MAVTNSSYAAFRQATPGSRYLIGGSGPHLSKDRQGAVWVEVNRKKHWLNGPANAS